MPIASFVDSFLTPWDSLPMEERGKELPTDLKSEEEIAKFTVDENLSDVERAVRYLQGGILIQQKQAIASLPYVIMSRGRPAWDAVAQPLKVALTKMDAEAQIATAEAICLIAKGRYLTPSDVQACLLPLVCRNINKEKSEEETEAWLVTMLELTPLVDKDCVKLEIMPLALSKGDMEEVSSKCICATLLGAVAPRLTKDEIENGFFKKALSMCQDVEHQVRRSMCMQLPSLARSVGKDLTQKHILDEILELLKDEEIQVRDAAFMSLVGILDWLPPESRKTRVLPVIREHMRPFELDAVMQRCVARNFGRLMAQLRTDLENGDNQVFYACFKHLCAKSDDELRTACASQFASVLKSATSSMPNAYATQFSDTLYCLATDSTEDIRLSIAEQMHEIAPLVGNREACSSHFAKPLVRLLRDDSQAVQAALLPNLTLTLQYFTMALPNAKTKQVVAALPQDPNREAAMNDILRALVDLESKAKLNWRLQEGLASSFPSFPYTFSSDQIYDHFLPMAFRFLSGSVAAVRPAAAEGVVSFLRYNRKDRQRADTFLKIIRDYARGKSFTQRLAFVEIAKNLLNVFSSRFVKDWILDLCLELLFDPVPNIRLTVAPLLPLLKHAIKLPEDVDHLERLNNAIANSMSDNDRDVAAIARNVNNTFKKTPVRMAGGAGLMDMNGLAGGMSNFEEDDEKKEEAEQQSPIFSIEDGKEIRAEILQVSPKKKVADSVGAVPKLKGRISNTGTGPLPIKQISSTVGGISGHRAAISAPLPKVPVSSSARPAAVSSTSRTSTSSASGSRASPASGPTSSLRSLSSMSQSTVSGSRSPSLAPSNSQPGGTTRTPAGSARVAATALHGKSSPASAAARPAPPSGPRNPVASSRKPVK